MPAAKSYRDSVYLEGETARKLNLLVQVERMLQHSPHLAEEDIINSLVNQRYQQTSEAIKQVGLILKPLEEPKAEPEPPEEA